MAIKSTNFDRKPLKIENCSGSCHEKSSKITQIRIFDGKILVRNVFNSLNFNNLMNVEDMISVECIDPILDKKIRSIRFLRFKIKNLIEKILEQNVIFSTNLMEESWKKFKRGKIGSLPKKRDKNRVYEITDAYEGLNMENELFFYFDSFLGDIKRCAEFCIRFLLVSEGVEDHDFKFTQLLDQIDPKYKDKRNKYVEWILDNYSTYASFIQSEISWFKEMNKNRNTITHYHSLNKTGKFEICFIWDPGIPFTNKPRISYPIIPLLDKPIQKMLDEYNKKLEAFVEKTLELKKDLLIHKPY